MNSILEPKIPRKIQDSAYELSGYLPGQGETLGESADPPSILRFAIAASRRYAGHVPRRRRDGGTGRPSGTGTNPGRGNGMAGTKEVTWTIREARVEPGKAVRKPTDPIATIHGKIERSDMSDPLKGKEFTGWTDEAKAAGWTIDTSDLKSEGIIRVTGMIGKGGRPAPKILEADDAIALLS